MNEVEDARAALEFAVSKMADEQDPMVPAKALRPVMVAADALGDARELRGHLGACGRCELIPGEPGTEVPEGVAHCPDAPVKEVTA